MNFISFISNKLSCKDTYLRIKLINPNNKQSQNAFLPVSKLFYTFTAQKKQGIKRS